MEPPPCPARLQSIQSTLESWVRDEQRGSEQDVKHIVGLCDVSFLTSLPLPAGVRWPKDPGAANFHHLWRKQVAKNLVGEHVARRGVLEDSAML